MNRPQSRSTNTTKRLLFIDIFAGCGGLSLGLLDAGWTGQFAIEKNRDAFNTLAKNLIGGKRHSFNWPEWLPKKACTSAKLLSKYDAQLKKLHGKIGLLAGAPPCQGFSLAGRRLHSDPRNLLFRQYLAVVKKIKPRLLLVENVQGFSFPFKTKDKKRAQHRAYSDVLREKLEGLGYTVFSELVNFSQFGVPQNRNRFILIAIVNGDSALDRLKGITPFDLLRTARKTFLQSKQLRVTHPISAKQAISDLEVKGKKLVFATRRSRNGFKQIKYIRPDYRSHFIKLMRRTTEAAPTSLRLPRHKLETVSQFRRIMETCRQGQSLTDPDRERLGIRKQVLMPLHPKQPASTVTTLPDDMIHYSEPRILTVRENARLQTFPDWFEFTGKYTTGGKDRRHDCPRYTQVGNAVPPLFAEAIGLVLRELAS